MRKLVAFALVACPLMAIDPVGAGNSDTAHAFSLARIMAPVKVISTDNLNFGAIVLDKLGEPASVELIFSSGNGSDPVLTQKNLVNCGFYTNSVKPTAAFFHYQRDGNFGNGNGGADGDPNVSITITGSDLQGPGGKVCHLTTKNDLPVDSCLYFPSAPGVTAKHFAVFGKLDIPADAIPGYYAGLITVKVAYN